MADIRIDIRYDGLDRVKESVDRVLDAIQPPSLTESVAKGADEFVKTTQAAAPIRSGKLRASIDKTETGPTSFDIGPHGLVYAAMQNYGGDVHSTRPGGYMKIDDARGPTFLKDARIPGTHYMDKGFAAGVEPAVEAVKAAVAEKIG